MLTQQAIRRQLAVMPHDLYLVRLIHHRTRRPLPGHRLWTPTELLHPAIIKFLRIRNREAFDVYIHRMNKIKMPAISCSIWTAPMPEWFTTSVTTGMIPVRCTANQSRPPASLDSRERLAAGAFHCCGDCPAVSPRLSR
jgi:hypothetical protein